MAKVVPRIPGLIIWSKEGKSGPENRRCSHVPDRRCVGNSNFLGGRSREEKKQAEWRIRRAKELARGKRLPASGI